MSGQEKRTMSMEALEEEAAYWLLRRHFFDWTPDDQTKLDIWLSTSPSNQIVYWRLNAALARTERLAALRSSRHDSSSRGSRAGRALFRVAAVVAIAGMLGAAGTTYFLRSQEKVFATPVGGHEIIALGNGSQVELNTGTTIRTRLNGGQRIVTLVKGEAYFQIRHDAEHPFIVNAAGHRVTDLGTKFLVRNNAGRLEVMLMEGRAKFESEDISIQTLPALLTPGDVVVATANSMSLTKQAPEYSANELSWRHGVLVFQHTTLAAAAVEFNRYNQKKLIVGDTAAARLQIDGTFPTNDPASFADIAGDILHLRIEKRGDETVISR